MQIFSKNTIYQVDAFTNEVFKGNPAAVMLVDEMPSEDFMQKMAMEMNLSETAFACPSNGTFLIRYFTPLQELPLAGHPTLATAHIMYELGLVPHSEKIVFEAKGGILELRYDNGFIVMKLPQYTLERIEYIPDLRDIIGFQPAELYASQYGWKIAVANSDKDIQNANPQFSKLSEMGFGHMMITAKSDSPEQDFVVRCFAPELGVDEDPVTGSAHCALIPLWAKKLQKTEMKSKQLSRRTGQLSVRLLNNRVEIKGKAVTVFIASIKI